MENCLYNKFRYYYMDTKKEIESVKESQFQHCGALFLINIARHMKNIYNDNSDKHRYKYKLCIRTKKFTTF